MAMMGQYPLKRQLISTGYMVMMAAVSSSETSVNIYQLHGDDGGSKLL
jgi:hypothetical protein